MILGHELLKIWKLGNAKKRYDKTTKGYLLFLGNEHSFVCCPKNELKNSLGVKMPYIVFQVYIPSGALFHLELSVMVSDMVSK